MILEEQIISLLFSFSYGIISSLLTTINYKIIISNKPIIKIIGSTFLITIIILGFYCGLLYINCGVIHPYFLLMLTLGYCLGSVNYKKILVYLQKK